MSPPAAADARVAALERQRRLLLAALLLLLAHTLAAPLLRAPLHQPPPAPAAAHAQLTGAAAQARFPPLPLPPSPPPAAAEAQAAAAQQLGECRARQAQAEAALAAALQPYFRAPLSLFVGILSRSAPEGAQERAAARATTLQLLHAALRSAGGAWQAAHKFIVTSPPQGSPALAALQAEAAAQGDLVLLPDGSGSGEGGALREDRRTLSARVHHIFHWAARENATWVLKTDTDAFVNYGLLLGELARAPRVRHAWGRLGGPPDSPDFPSDGLPPAAAPYFEPGAATPYYLAGWGYVLSTDLVADAGGARGELGGMLDCEYYEDICTGLRLLPYAPRYVNDARFCQDDRQWGYHTTLCSAGLGARDAVLRHHVGVARMAELYEAFAQG